MVDASPFHDAITSQTFIRRVHFLEKTDSTNHYARQLSADELQEAPLLAITTNQTAGRGRYGNEWWSGQGSLTCSVVVEDSRVAVPDILAVATALAVGNAIKNECSELKLEFKWPNDVFVNRRKVAGILIESLFKADRNWFAIGLGVNTNCRLSHAPTQLKQIATSLLDETRRPVNQTRFLVNLLQQLDQNLNSENGSDQMIQRYSDSAVFGESCPLIVKTAGGEKITGIFAGFGCRGQLRLTRDGETIEINSGRIVDYG